MTDEQPPAPEEPPWEQETARLQKQLTVLQAEVRRVQGRSYADTDRLRAGLVVMERGTGSVAVVLMAFGLLMKVFIPVSGEDKSLTLFQVLDAKRTPDLLSHSSSWGTGAGWFIPIAMVLICAVLVGTITAGSGSTSQGRGLVTVTEVFCWCLSIGCVLGFAALAGMHDTVGVPGGLMVILGGGLLGIITCRVARTKRG